MTFEEADRIFRIWGRYLEYCSRIVMVFGNHIPESFLPFPEDTLFEAFTILNSHYHKIGNYRMVDLIKETSSNLEAYVDDEKALIEAAKIFVDQERRQLE